MPSTNPLRSADVVVGCVTEDNPKYLGQSLRLVQSIRWFGGGLSRSRIVVAAVEHLDPRARRALEAYGADIRIVPRFHPRNPASNRLQIFGELAGAPEQNYLLLDCDTIVVRDPLPLLHPGVFHAKIAPFPTVSHDVFARLFAHFGLPLPAKSHVTGYTGTPTIPYFNAGVFSIPAELAPRLASEWRHYNAILADEPALVAPCQKHMHQASLALALATSGIPTAEAGPELNYQLNGTHVPAPPGYAEVDPAIIHYHDLEDVDGLLLPCPFPPAQARIDLFHERLREERAQATASRPSASVPRTSPQRIAVLGMHRSGTSLLAQLLAAMGCYAGEPNDLPPPDVFNPTGYWEHRKVWELDEEIFSALGASWLDPSRADVDRLDEDARRAYTQRARDLARTLDQHGTWMVKDPRLSILFPFWRNALEDPICVLGWREPVAVARSLVKRNRMPLAAGLALWEEYTRAMLASTIGLRRMLVSYESLIGDPSGTAAGLHRELAAAGATDLRVPSARELRAIVDPALNRSGRGEEDKLLNGWQLELRDALRSGDALRRDVGPIHPDTRALLVPLIEARNQRAAHPGVASPALLLDEVFASKSWRIGFGITRLWRTIVRSHEETAVDRWMRHPDRGRM